MNISLIIPAAGMSTRYSANKLFKKIDEKPVFERSINPYLNLNLDIILILGNEGNHLRRLATDAFGQSIRFEVNKSFQDGLSASIITGVLASNPNTEYFAFSLGDKPFIKQDTVIKLLKELKQNRPQILVPTFNNIPGHPTFFSNTFRNELLALKGDSGGIQVIEKHRSNVTFSPVEDEGIVMDMDMYFSDNNT